MIERILSRIGKAVTFRYPANEGDSRGTLRDRYVRSALSRAGVPYWDTVDLIDFQDEEAPQIRIRYYRAPTINGQQRLIWGAQTTIAESGETWIALFLGAAREKPWFGTS